MSEYPKPGESVDLLVLRDLRIREKINVYLYMDAEIAKTSTVEEDIKKYRFTDMDFVLSWKLRTGLRICKSR